MKSPGPVRQAFVRLLLLAAAAVALTASPAWARGKDDWPSLHVRGVALRPPCGPCDHPYFPGDARCESTDTDTAHYCNANNNATLIWDRDPVAESRPDFGGYNVYRSHGPVASIDPTRTDYVQVTLLRRYIKRPEGSFGNGDVNPDNGSASRLWTFRDNRLPTAGFFIDPDSIYYFIQTLSPVINQTNGQVIRVDTVFTRQFDKYIAGPKNGFDYYYYVTYADTTVSGEDLTPLAADGSWAGPIRPTGAVVAANLDAIKVVPNPYQFHEDWDLPSRRKIRFTNLPARATISIYTAWCGCWSRTTRSTTAPIGTSRTVRATRSGRAFTCTTSRRPTGASE